MNKINLKKKKTFSSKKGWVCISVWALSSDEIVEMNLNIIWQSIISSFSKEGNSTTECEWKCPILAKLVSCVSPVSCREYSLGKTFSSINFPSSLPNPVLSTILSIDSQLRISRCWICTRLLTIECENTYFRWSHFHTVNFVKFWQ